MAHKTILWVTADEVSTAAPVVSAFHKAGYEVISTPSPSQAMAVLFLIRSVRAVVLDQRLPKSGALAGSLRSLRPEVPILLLSREQVSPLPQAVDGCVSVGEGLDGLLPSLEMVLSSRHSAA